MFEGKLELLPDRVELGTNLIKIPQYLLFLWLKYHCKLPRYFKSNVSVKCYKTFYHGNLVPFDGNYRSNIVLQNIMRIVRESAINYRSKKFYDIGPGPNLKY